MSLYDDARFEVIARFSRGLSNSPPNLTKQEIDEACDMRERLTLFCDRWQALKEARAGDDQAAADEAYRRAVEQFDKILTDHRAAQAPYRRSAA